MQMPSRVATGSAGRDEAWQIIRQNLEYATRMIDEALGRPETRDSRLLLFPEFAFQGPPLKEDVQEWIDSYRRMLDERLDRFGELLERTKGMPQ